MTDEQVFDDAAQAMREFAYEAGIALARMVDQQMAAVNSAFRQVGRDIAQGLARGLKDTDNLILIMDHYAGRRGIRITRRVADGDD